MSDNIILELEQLLGKPISTNQLTPRELGLIYENSLSCRKDSGSYYTPECVVNYIVRETLAPIVKSKQADEILDIKICDPAMGAGYFLIGALDYLTKEYIKKKENGLLNEQEVKIKILHNCIYGMDIDENATKLAKISLWLETNTVEDLNNQIKCCNSLTTDISQEFPEVVAAGGFDAILGNPPYIGEKGHKTIFDEVKNTNLHKCIYKRHMDYFYFFIAQSIELLKSGGRLSFITTSYWKSNESAEHLRNFMNSNGSLECFIDFQDWPIFKNAKGQHNCVFVYEKKAKLLCEHYIGTVDDNDKICLKRVAQTVPTKISQDEMVKIGDLFFIKQGIVTGCDKVTNSNFELLLPHVRENTRIGDGIFVIKTEELERLKLTHEEKAFIKPLYTAKNIKTNGISIETDKFIVISNGITDLNLYDNLKKHFEKFENILRNRSQMEHCLDWWDLHQLRLKDKNKTGNIKDYFYNKPKIIYTSLSENINFQYSEEEFYCTGGGLGGIYYIYHKEGDYDVTLALSNYLNSAEFEERITSEDCLIPKKGKVYNFSGNVMKEILVPKSIFYKIYTKTID